MKKIALTISTGRPNVNKVVKAFIENAILYGYNPKDFSIYLSIDTEYQNTKVEDFQIDEETSKKLNKIEYITKEIREKMADQIIFFTGIDVKIVESLFRGRGYSKQRNSALLFALKDKNDFAICIDDDESPFVPIKKENGSVKWENLDFFTPHIKELSSGTDITRGPYLGYKSPIPSDFEKDIPEEIRKKLGEALQWGNDVITKDSFLNLMNKIKYLTDEELKNSARPFIVEQGIHGKNIFAGNMGINLKSLRLGKIPLFFTPPEARGEDTIFALQLKKVLVKEVNSFIFHDPFNMYPEIFEGKFPKILRNIPVTADSKKRFANALIGWLKYAPILISMTSLHKKEKIQRIEKMLETINEPAQQLAEILDCSELKSCHNILKKYYEQMDSHQGHLIDIQKEWKTKILPLAI